MLVVTKYRPELIDPAAAHSPKPLDIVARALEAGVGLGLIHTSDPEMTAYLLDAALAYNMHTHITFGDPPDLARLIAAAKETFHKTLALPAASPKGASPTGRGSPRTRKVR